MQLYTRNPETLATTTKRHPNDTPITPPSILTSDLEKTKDVKEKVLASTVARKNTTLVIVT